MRPRRLFTTEVILKTRDRNQDPYTASVSGRVEIEKAVCNVVAVTAEKKVAIVVR